MKIDLSAKTYFHNGIGGYASKYRESLPDRRHKKFHDLRLK